MSFYVSNKNLIKTITTLSLLAAGVLLTMYLTHHATFIARTVRIYEREDQQKPSSITQELHTPNNELVNYESSINPLRPIQSVSEQERLQALNSRSRQLSSDSSSHSQFVPDHSRRTDNTLTATESNVSPQSITNSGESDDIMVTRQSERNTTARSIRVNSDVDIEPGTKQQTLQQDASDPRERKKFTENTMSVVKDLVHRVPTQCNGSTTWSTVDKAIDLSDNVENLNEDQSSVNVVTKGVHDKDSIVTKFAEDNAHTILYSNWSRSEIETTSKFQQSQVAKFCSKYHLNGARLVLPRDGSPSQQVLFRHLLLNDKSKTMFCFIPKVGCTNLKLLFFTSQDMISKEELLKSRDRVNQHHLEEAMSIQSLSRRLKSKRLRILRSYFKFVMLRHPLERLVSGYRSKVLRHPLVGLKSETPHYNWFRKKIYSYTHPEEYKTWVETKGACPINISFSDFIDFWLSTNSDGLLMNEDEHFQSIVNLCQPCRVRYGYYGNFKTFDQDAKVLMSAIGADRNLLRSGYYDNGEGGDDSVPTKDLVKQFYSTLNIRQKLGIVRKFSQDLDFYYHIFPSEADTHRTMLEVDVGLIT